MPSPLPSESSFSTRRVVVTGMGLVSPLGLNLKETWEALLSGKSGIRPIQKFSTEGCDVRIAGEIHPFSSDSFIPKKEQKKMDLFIQYSLMCTKMALDQSQLPLVDEVKEQTGVFIGVGMGGLPSIEEQHTRWKEKGPGKVSPFFIPMVITNMAAGQISIAYGFQGPNFSVTSACASGAHSIGEAFLRIQCGFTDVMIAGGTESTVCPLGIEGFAAMKALSTRNHDPEKASRPFDRDRDGFVLSEGAAVLVLESLDHARKRGANILAEVKGYGYSSDAYHMTNPAPEGRGAALAIQRALVHSKISPDDVDYINAHGTSTPVGDELETLAIKKSFGDAAKKLWVSSTKSMTGHTLGAAGAIESVFCVQALLDQVVPPTINLENPSESCDLDYVPHQARSGNIHIVMNNSFGFGGTNASLIFSKFQG